MTTASTDPRPERPGRVRRERGARESLLGIVLVLEAITLFFVTLVLFGRDLLPAPVAWGGGLGAIVLVAVVSRTTRWTWGVVLGWLVQVGLVALGLLDPVVFPVAAVFLALWVYCLVKGGQLDRTNEARRRALDGSGDGAG